MRSLQTLPMPVPRAREIALGSKTGCLGAPTKMPGYSYGISATKCQRGAELAKDPRTICSDCYALTQYYLTKFEVAIAHKRRLESLTHDEWVPAMVTLILSHVEKDTPYFRWHDSGDLQGVWHLAKIVEVCIQTPEVNHWLPTHEPYMILEYFGLAKEGKVPPVPANLCIRISADFNDQPPAQIEGLEDIPTLTTHHGHGNHLAVKVPGRPGDSIECKSYLPERRRAALGEDAVSEPVPLPEPPPANQTSLAFPGPEPEPGPRTRRPRTVQGAGFCGKCRACWDPRVKNISFPIHGEKHRKFQLTIIQE